MRLSWGKLVKEWKKKGICDMMKQIISNYLLLEKCIMGKKYITCTSCWNLSSG